MKRLTELEFLRLLDKTCYTGDKVFSGEYDHDQIVAAAMVSTRIGELEMDEKQQDILDTIREHYTAVTYNGD